ncbi:MAG: hypothetical protein WDN44_16370 [Sphingomonas sp.]
MGALIARERVRGLAVVHLQRSKRQQEIAAHAQRFLDRRDHRERPSDHRARLDRLVERRNASLRSHCAEGDGDRAIAAVGHPRRQRFRGGGEI